MAERSQRIRLEDLTQGMRVDGLVAGRPVTILTTVQTAPDAFTVVFTKPDGNPDHVLALRSVEDRLKIVASARRPCHSMGMPPSTGWPPKRRASRWPDNTTRWSR